MPNPFIHIELSTSDVDKAKSFYGSLFDWKLKDEQMGPDMTYTMVSVGEGTGGGMMKQMMPGAPSAWLPYVDVSDIKASVQKVTTLGGKVVRDVMEVMDAGYIAIITDPTGAYLGLWQTKAK